MSNNVNTQAQAEAEPHPPSNLDKDDLAFASSACAAVLNQSPKGGQQLLWGIVVFIFAIIVWASKANIDEFTRGEGRVIPSQSVQMVQNLEGGIVAEVFVREGQRIQRGDALMRLDDVRFSSSLRESELNQSQLLVKTERLKAESEGLVFDGSNLLDKIPEALIRSEYDLYLARQRELQSNKRVIEQQMVQKDQELIELKARTQQLQTSYEFLNEELEATRPLVKQGAASKVEVLRLERQANDLSGELEAAQLSRPRIEASLKELEEKLQTADSAFRSEAQSEYNKALGELSRLQESSEAIADQVDRTLVKSPVTGTVKQLFVKTLGGVVQPGMDLMAIVPSEDRLLIETRVRPADIAFLHPGQKSTVKFTAYDFSIHGGLDGHVVNISPDTIVEEDASFYLVRIETDETFLGTPANPLPIIPGMTVNVDIITGKKTVMDYILKPILKTKQLALRER